MDFESLVGSINLVQDALQAQAAHAVNLSLTARNWLVGYYIVEFEQHGEDRAKYGEKLLKELAKSLNRRGLGERRLYEYRLTYQIYPQLGGVVAEYVSKNGQNEILRLPTAKLQTADIMKDEKMNAAHPFMEGNGRATRIWLDLIFKKRLKMCVDWSKIDKREYLDAMIATHTSDNSKIRELLKLALTDRIDDHEIFMKGIDYSYYYEQED